LNLVLENFKLPEGARLFLISATSGDIKGAYTSANNSESKIFAIEPVGGDELLVQYEEPVNVSFPGEFVITKVSHDFIGVTYDPHRPLGPSGNCNVNINCDVANEYKDNRDAVCRIIIVNELCSGTLINNTANNGIPYVLTAYHCISTEFKAQSSIFLFNFESPYCSNYNSPTIAGDISNSMTGSSLKASFDSLDFSLVRLNQIPPKTYRTYLAGWNRVNLAATNSFSIHHPLGDVKKIAIDLDAPITKKYQNSFLANGFWNIVSWEYGVTEAGSSGAPLFDQNRRVIGTLTGGSADCVSRKNDYYEKFALAWDYKSQSNKQLKAWLDPINSNKQNLDGLKIDSGDAVCNSNTNFLNSDTHALLKISNGLEKGYWCGTNTDGFTEFAEKYSFARNCEVQGISLGVATAKIHSSGTTPSIDIKVYEGTDKPVNLIYTESYDIRNFYSDGMNYIKFENPVKVSGNFFVSIDVSKLPAADTLVVYMANRKFNTTNSLYVEKNSAWTTYNAQNLNGNGSAMLTELVACNIDDPTSNGNVLTNVQRARFFPNPLYGNTELKVQTEDSIECADDIAVYDLLGKKQNLQIRITDYNAVSINFSGKKPGIYFIELQAGGQHFVGKVSYLP
jgi:V8-like Glu-specific endopeptidase